MGKGIRSCILTIRDSDDFKTTFAEMGSCDMRYLKAWGRVLGFAFSGKEVDSVFQTTITRNT